MKWWLRSGSLCIIMHYWCFFFVAHLPRRCQCCRRCFLMPPLSTDKSNCSETLAVLSEWRRYPTQWMYRQEQTTQWAWVVVRVTKVKGSLCSWELGVTPKWENTRQTLPMSIGAGVVPSPTPMIITLNTQPISILQPEDYSLHQELCYQKWLTLLPLWTLKKRRRLDTSFSVRRISVSIGCGV